MHSALSAFKAMGTQHSVPLTLQALSAECVHRVWSHEPHWTPWASSQGYYSATSVFPLKKPVFKVEKTSFLGWKRFFQLKPPVFPVEKGFFGWKPLLCNTGVFNKKNVASSYYFATLFFSNDLLLCNINFFNWCNICFFNQFPGVITFLKTQGPKYRFSGFI